MKLVSIKIFIKKQQFFESNNDLNCCVFFYALFGRLDNWLYDER